MSKLIEGVKGLLKRTPLYVPYQARRWNKIYAAWLRSGRPTPPPQIVKQRIVREYARRFDLHIFVETGTYLGDMVNAVKKDFDRIYSIELSLELYQNAKQRFKNQTHISILQGDSGKVLKGVLDQVQEPCLFWLDGHYSEGITAKGDLETPVIEELTCIANHPMARRHVILIDDARCFTGKGDYPTVKEINDIVAAAGYNDFKVEHDIICVRADSAQLKYSEPSATLPA